MLKRLLKYVCALSVIAAACLLYGFTLEPKTLKLREVKIASPNYTGGPLRIAVVSDIHMGGRHVPAARVAEIVSRINALSPNLILIAGDFINGSTPRALSSPAFNADVDAGVAHLAALSAKQGVFASIGNHDVFYGADFVAAQLRANGLTVLENSAANLPSGLCIVGLADHDMQTEDPAAFDQCEVGQTPLAVMHSPDSFVFLRADTALAVAGHTHGGQINLPLLGRAVTATEAGRKFAYGEVLASDVPAFVTAGIGTSILPARFRAPPEIVLITLTAAQ